MKSRSASEWLKAYGGIHQEFTSKGFKPKLKTLDNEASGALKSYFTENDVDYQLVPPHCHRCNAAERSIRTFKVFFCRPHISRPRFPITFVGSSIASSRNDTELTAQIQAASTINLQQRIFTA
jgi:hypothetical protein